MVSVKNISEIRPRIGTEFAPGVFHPRTPAITRAYELGRELHGGQLRYNGDSYFETHCVWGGGWRSRPCARVPNSGTRAYFWSSWPTRVTTCSHWAICPKTNAARRPPKRYALTENLPGFSTATAGVAGSRIWPSPMPSRRPINWYAARSTLTRAWM